MLSYVRSAANYVLHAGYQQPGMPANVHIDVSEGPPTTLLLIGSTGNGKSAFGNFMINPGEETISGDDQFFRTARDSKPETQTVKSVQLLGENGKPIVQVIDTPGLNESASKDLEHMVQLVENLKATGNVSACVLCIKFESKIDMQYRSTVAYYRNLLPSLFEGNLVIALTAFQTDPRSERERKLRRVDVQAVVKNAQVAVRETCKLSYSPCVFLMDSLPLSDQELQVSLTTRKAIVDFIRKTMKPKLVSELTVVKTDELKRRDAEQIKQLEGEISGYSDRLKEVDSDVKLVLNLLELMEKKRLEVIRKIDKKRGELRELDTAELVTAEEWSLEESWKLFEPWQTAKFHVSSKWPLTKVERWDNGHLSWARYESSLNPGYAKGEVQGKFFRGLYASVTLKARKRTKYQQNITTLKQHIFEEERELSELDKEHEEFQKTHVKKHETIQLLQSFIDDRKAKTRSLSRQHISVEEAYSRLQELQKP